MEAPMTVSQTDTKMYQLQFGTFSTLNTYPNDAIAK